MNKMIEYFIVHRILLKDKRHIKIKIVLAREIYGKNTVSPTGIPLL